MSSSPYLASGTPMTTVPLQYRDVCEVRSPAARCSRRPDDEVLSGRRSARNTVHLSQISGNPAVGRSAVFCGSFQYPGHHRIASCRTADHSRAGTVSPAGRIHHLDLKVWTHLTDRADPSIHRVVGARLRETGDVSVIP